jgi:hypothetical protein
VIFSLGPSTRGISRYLRSRTVCLQASPSSCSRVQIVRTLAPERSTERGAHVVRSLWVDLRRGPSAVV